MTYKVIRVTPDGREVAFLDEEPLLGLTHEAAKLLAIRAENEEADDATFEVVEESESEEPVEVAVD